MLKSRFRHKPPFKRNHDYAKYFADSGFNVRTLFSQGEQGAWYDPSDLTSMYQDSAGTTAAVVGQPVGMILDKRLGMALGADQKSVGTTALLGAATAASYNTTTGAGTVTRVDASNQSYVTFTGLTSSFYEATLSNTGGNGISVRSGGAAGAAAVTLAGGASTVVRLATSGGQISITSAAGSAAFTLTSLKEQPGNHATQGTSASRPTLSARYNLLTKTEQFDDAAWTKTTATVSANAVTAPNGALLDKVIPDAAAANGLVNQPQNVIAGVGYVCRFLAKAGEMSSVSLVSNADTTFRLARWDLSAGTVLATGTGWTASIESAGNGFYWCRATFTASATAAAALQISNNSGTVGDGTSGFYAGCVDFRTSADAALFIPAYQRVNTATDYDTAGFPTYLLFDGFDDGMVTSAIDFTGTDKMTVWAGVYKASDAAGGIVVELSSVATNPGSFAVEAPSGAAANYKFDWTIAALDARTATTFTAPTANVLSCAFTANAGSNLNILPRVNGAVPTLTASAGSAAGALGNYPLYIGRRNSATLPLNGRIYSLIVRGAASDSAQISAGERYAAGKQGITL